jgi:hypothetical protein
MRRRWKWLVTLLIIDQACWQGSGVLPPHRQAPGLFAPSRPVMPGTVALLVNGALSPPKNHRRYWNNTSLVFTALKTTGFERLAVLQSDGLSSDRDRQSRSFLGMFGTGHLLDSPRDLDGDGRDDVAGPGTIEALEETLRDLGRSLRPGDRLLVFFTGHGQLRVDRGLRGVAMMWSGGELRGEDLDRMLRAAVPAGCWVAIVATQCHSKIFLDEITRPNTLLVASGWPLWIWSTQDYSVFPYHLAGALLGRDPATGSVLPEGPSTSLRGAVRAAASRDHVPEWPRIRVNGPESSIPAPF